MGLLSSARGVLLATFVFGAVACATETAAPAKAPSPEQQKDLHALYVTVDGSGVVAELFVERVRASRSMTDRADGATEERTLRVTISVDTPTPVSGGLSQKFVLTGTLGGTSCEVMRLERSITLPGGSMARAADGVRLLREGIDALFTRLESVAADVGPKMTCVATR